jgi:hypothetical protein
LGIVSVLAGLFVFSTRHAHEVSADVNEEVHSAVASRVASKIASKVTSKIRHASFLEDGLDDGPEVVIQPPLVRVDLDHDFPFHSGDFKPHVEFSRSTEGMPSWMVISLGSLLLIIGTLLATRQGTRPMAMKALTLLGAGAVVYSLVSFFSTAPRPIGNHDRVVRLDSSNDRPVRSREALRSHEAERPEASADRASRPSRAKRPSSRPARPHEADAAVEALPPRAGTIPVEVELAKSQPPAAVAPAAQAAAESPSATPAAPSTAPPTVPASPPTAPTQPSPPADVPAAAPAEAPAAAPTAVAAAPSPPPSVAADAPRARPAWVDAPARLADSVYSITVSSGRFVTVPECQRELDSQIKQEADHYIDEYVGERASTLIDIPLSYLKERVKKAEYAELVQSESLGQMHQIHALLEFDDQARADFRRLWHNALVTDRLWYTGSGVALVLALLATFYGYLKLDVRTGGAQKGRLQLAATLVALIIAAGALLVRWAVPL